VADVSGPLLRIVDVSKQFDGFVALSHVSFDLAAGERFGLIGPNGSGKTTLINCVSGVERISGGMIVYEGHDISGLPAYRRTRLGIARSFQIPRPFFSMTVVENLMVPVEYVAHRATELISQSKIRSQAMEILASVDLADKADTLSTQLTQIELRKLELARAMAARPRLLISDEAMAGLAIHEIDEILKILFELNASGVTVVMIEHIMQAVMRFSQRVLCLNAGKVICEGPPSLIVKDPEVRRAYLGT
jgi:branched-chain amino acid transport system ATP-binding protein